MIHLRVTYWVDVDVRPFLNANAVWPIVRPFPVIVAVGRVRVVSFSTICVLDFQQRANTHCMPTRSNHTSHTSCTVTIPHTAQPTPRDIDSRQTTKTEKINERKKYYLIISRI